MKNILLLITFFSLCFNLKAQNSSAISKNFTGKLIGHFSDAPKCDEEAYASVMEFEIIEFNDLNYTKKLIGVFIPCPNEYGKDFFKVGKTYKMEVHAENQYDLGLFYHIFNEKRIKRKFDTKIKYWAGQDTVECIKVGS